MWIKEPDLISTVPRFKDPLYGRNNDNMNSEPARTIFGEYSYQIPAISKLVERLEPFRYHFMPEDMYRRFLAESPMPYTAQSIYCTEILRRAHIAAVTSLIRADRWLKGILNAFDQNNYYVFAACFRGFLEFSADSHYVLAPIPRTLSEIAEPLCICLNKVPRTELYLFNELEDRLIHYSHARRIGKSEAVPPTHKAKTMREYLDYLQEHGEAALHDFYSELCEITHPAADSVLCMLETTDGSNITMNKEFDRDMMIYLSQRNSASTYWLFAQCISPALMTLGLINLMGIPELKTAALDHIDLSNVGRWSEFSEKVSRAFGV